MSWTSNSPGPHPYRSPSQQRSTGWQVANSWWILTPLLTCGMLSWLGFVVAGAATRRRRYWIAAGFYATLLGGFFFGAYLTEGNDSMPDWVAILLLVPWFGATLHAAIWNRTYLDDLATTSLHRAPQSYYGPPVQQHQPAAQPFLGVSASDYYGPGAPPQPLGSTPPVSTPPVSTPPVSTPPAATPPTPRAPAPPPAGTPASGRLSAASATAAQLSALHGVDDDLAARIVATRQHHGGFRDLDHMIETVGLKPHEVVRLRGHLDFGTSAHQPGTPRWGSSGRILDV